MKLVEPKVSRVVEYSFSDAVKENCFCGMSFCDGAVDDVLISDVCFDCCVFKGIDFCNVSFDNVELVDVVFDSCDLSNKKFDSVSVHRVKFVQHIFFH